MIKNFPAAGIQAMLVLCLYGGLGAELPKPQDLAPPEKALAMLSSEHFEERSKAHEDLQKWAQQNPKSAPEELYGVWSKCEEPEAKTRLRLLMKQVLLERDFPGKGFLGIKMQNVSVNINGKALAAVMVISVLPDTPAQKAGLMPRDVIMKVDDCELAGREFAVDRLRHYIQTRYSGEQVTLSLWRNTQPMRIMATLMGCPPEVDAEVGKPGIAAERFTSDWLKKMRE